MRESNKLAFNRYDETQTTRQFSARNDITGMLIREIGPSFEKYRDLFEKAAGFEVEVPFPVHVDFETASVCNLKCPMCTHAQVDQSKLRNRFLDFDLFKSVIDEGVKYTLKSIGLDQEGEPLLNKNLVQFIQYARKKGIQDVILNTNALALTQKKTEEILNSGLTRIQFSLDAITKETYDKIRLGSDYDRVYENIFYLIKRKKDLGLALPITRVSFIKMSVNESELDKFVEFWEDKVEHIAIQEYHRPGLNNAKTQHFYSKSRPKRIEFRCTQPWFRSVILSNGNVACCCLLGYTTRLTFGNIKEKSLYEIWNSEGPSKLRKIHIEGKYYLNPICKECVSNFT